MKLPVRIAASLLAADFTRLGDEVRAMDAAGADAIHVDVMDGNFVPDLTMGPAFVRALRPCTALPLDVHLMVASADSLLEPFADAGADSLTVHVEACPHLDRSLRAIRDLGKQAGVSINPGTSEVLLEPVLGIADRILVMTVNPGYGGQRFLPGQLAKIRAIRERMARRGRTMTLEVDGGVTPRTAGEAIEAGADGLVAGTAAFAGGPSSYRENLRKLRGGSDRGETD